MKRKAEGQPTAIKVKGTGFYDPAITTAFGSKRLPHGYRQDTRYAAIREARRVINEAQAAEQIDEATP